MIILGAELASPTGPVPRIGDLGGTQMNAVVKVQMRRFAISACLIVALLTGCLEESKPSDPTATNGLRTRSDGNSIQSGQLQDFGDFSFIIPKGWTAIPPDREKTLVILLKGGTNWQSADAMIKIDAGKPSTADIQKLAEQAASDFDGTVSPSAELYDGVESRRVDTLSKSKDYPLRVTLMIHNEKAYVVMAAANEGTDIPGAMNRIRESWTWH